MALLCQMHKLLVNLPNILSCFSSFIKSFIKIFETSVEYICCEIISADDTASGEAIRYKRLLSGYTVFNQWCYCGYETSSANWNTLERNAAGFLPQECN